MLVKHVRRPRGIALRNAALAGLIAWAVALLAYGQGYVLADAPTLGTFRTTDLIVDNRTTTAAMTVNPSVSPAALPSVPTITHDWDPGSCDAVIRVLPDDNGSIIGGLKPCGSGPASVGEVRIIRNVGGTDTEGTGSLIMLQDDVGSAFPFHLAGRNTSYVVPSLGSIILQWDNTDKWFVVGMTGASTPMNPRSITPAILPATDVNNYAPVDAVTGVAGQYVDWWHLQGQVGTNLTGIDATAIAGSNYGKRVLITNYGSGFTIKHMSGSSSPGNKIECPGGSDFVLTNLASVWLVYDAGNGVWFVESSRIGGV